MTIKDVLKTFAVEAGVQAATAVVRGWLNQQLKDVNPSDLYESIIEDRDLWNITPDKIKQTGRGFKGSFGRMFKKYQERITTQLLLEWMQKDHLALYSTLINTNVTREGQGVLWFDRQVFKIKQKIVEM